MREILFRGKRVDNGTWEYGAFVPDVLETRNGVYGLDGFIRRYNFEETLEVERETVGQYTGMKDKNGVRIFEGDIVIGRSGYCGNPDIPMREKKFVVKYWRGCFDELYCTDYYEFEVIGNVYNNPELMEEVQL